MEVDLDDDVLHANCSTPTIGVEALDPQYPLGAAPQQNLPVDARYTTEQLAGGSPYNLPPGQIPIDQTTSYNLTLTAPLQPQTQPQFQPACQYYTEVHGTPVFKQQQPLKPQCPAVSFPPQPQQGCLTSATNATLSGQQQLKEPQPLQVQGVPDYQKPTPEYGVWTTGIFDCLEDPANAMITFCFPCITFGQVAEILDAGRTSCFSSGLSYCCVSACSWSLTSGYRTRLRVVYGLPDFPCPDCLTHCFCDLCAICQEYRELRNRGLDPGIGWRGNVMRANARAAMVPPGNQTITRS